MTEVKKNTAASIMLQQTKWHKRCHCLGKARYCAKMGIKQAYHNIAIASGDRHLLGLHWDNKLYIHQVLSFRLCSTPLIFSAVADALLWIMKQRGTSWAIHYIDDFLTMGAPHSSECENNMALMQETWPTGKTNKISRPSDVADIPRHRDGFNQILCDFQPKNQLTLRRKQIAGEASKPTRIGTSSP